MDKLVEHSIRMLEIVEGENDFFRNDAKRQADIARAVYDTILRVQALERKADRKTEPQTDLLVKTPRKSRESHEKNCETCRDKDAYDEWEGNCDECENGSMYTPQTETEIAKAIVHKMIDDAVIAEDAYPDLRQRMHNAVDEYEPQTERSE
jgi:hypothetical protein